MVTVTGVFADHDPHLSGHNATKVSGIRTLNRAGRAAATSTGFRSTASLSLKQQPRVVPHSACDTSASADSISALIEKEMTKMRRFAWMLVRDNDHADDLVQDTIVRILTYSDRWQPGTNFSAWVKAIMRNILYTECGRRTREATALLLNPSPGEAIAPEQDDRLARKELTAAIGRLPRNQRIAVSLAAFGGWSSDEIASRMHISSNAVRCHLLRARRQLRDMASALPR